MSPFCATRFRVARGFLLDVGSDEASDRPRENRRSMPTTTRDGVTLHYETTGDGPTVVFVGDVGYGAWLWGWHHDAVAGPYEALVWPDADTLLGNGCFCVVDEFLLAGSGYRDNKTVDIGHCVVLLLTHL